MTNTQLAPRSGSAAFVRVVLATLFAFTISVCAPLFAQQKNKPADFDIPAGDAAAALRQFSNQAGEQLLFSSDAIAGAKTNAVKGQMSSREALEIMLMNSGLTADYDANTASFAVRKETETEAKNAQRVAQAAATTPSQVQKPDLSASENTVKLETFEVTGSRIRGVDVGANGQSVITYTRQDLDRLDVQSITDLQRFIPQLANVNYTSLNTVFAGLNTSGDSSSNGRLSFGAQGLHGLGNTATLVLVDGRRVNKLGVGNSGGEVYDLNGIPISAVERVEVLSDGASAVYGADALAGVINIILKKDYNGSEITTSYRNTFASDTAESRVQLTTGFSARGLSIMATVALAKTNSLAPRDRWFSASSDRTPYGGTNFIPLLADGVPGGTGEVRSTNGANLPGLNTPVAAIPTGSDGVHLTISDFAKAGPVAPFNDPAQYTQLGSSNERNLHLSAEYALRPWLRPYFDGSWNETRYEKGVQSPPLIGGPDEPVILPAGYAGNPFGVPIFVDRTLWEIVPDINNAYSVGTYSFVTGIRGDLPKKWRYDLSIQRQWTNYDRRGLTWSGDVTALQAAIDNPNPSQNPILLNDGITNAAASAGMLTKFLTPAAPFQEEPLTWTYGVNANGPVYRLPAGDIQLAAGAEAIEDYFHTGSLAPTDTLAKIGAQLISAPRRLSTAVFAETQIPLISAKQAVPLVQQWDINLSVRHDHYSDIASRTTPHYGLSYRPIKWLTLRAGYGTGFRVPSLYQIYQPVTTALSTLTASSGIIDPARNNQLVLGSVSRKSGGSRTLSPETSNEYNVGVSVDVPGVKGLSLALDYTEINNTGRIAAPALQDVINYFPERLTRAAPSAADQAAGLPGPITGFDLTTVNLARFEAASYDLQLRYDHTLGSWGDITLRVLATKPTISKQQAKPNLPLFSDLPGRPVRGNASIFWNRGAWEFGTVLDYTDDYAYNYSTSSPGTPIKTDLLWDFHAGYNFGSAPEGGTRWWRHPLANVRLNLSLINAFNKEPQFSTGGAVPVGNVLGDVDPRGRMYEVSLNKKF